ncbi:Hypothetical predicted protein [Pelobates cultripes]|uniref:Uncharacterized protein n=1 Tax=Pelobates cultripes TaxID=61616 RepID=A0AAD1W0H7_PELCU|nr:Hypothetical predicted protein [Pelobates cultripes]
MGKHSKSEGTPKPTGALQPAINASMRQYLTTQPDPDSQAPSEAYLYSDASTPSQGSPGREEHMEPSEPPPEDWMTLLRALPTKADLNQVTSALHASIRADLQMMRADLQGMADRMARVEADHNTLTAAQTAAASTQKRQTAQLQAMARHTEDLDNTGRRQNLRIGPTRR